MFKTTQELQDFILWARSKQIKAFKVGQMEVEFSDLAFVDAIAQIEPDRVETEEKNTSKTLVDTLESTQEEDEELLTWSSRP